LSEVETAGLAKQIYRQLRQRVQTCEILPGSELNEKQLMEETGYGRTPLREALLALQRDGLVEIFPRRGMRVTPFSEKLVNDIYQVRKLLEPAVVSSYGALYSKTTLLEYARQFEAHETGDFVAHYELDVAFHSFLVSVADNDTLTRMHGELMGHVFRLAMHGVVSGVSHPEDNNPQHLAIVEALLRENVPEARDALVFHINRSLIVSLESVRTMAERDIVG
jgi:GntR family transcriptional regulator, rspAB operon transcriptional repressor